MTAYLPLCMRTATVTHKCIQKIIVDGFISFNIFALACIVLGGSLIMLLSDALERTLAPQCGWRETIQIREAGVVDRRCIPAATTSV